MNAVTPVKPLLEAMSPVADVNLTAIFEREGIQKVQKLSCFYHVTLFDGRMGSGRSVGAALEAAKHPDAENVKKVRAA